MKIFNNRLFQFDGLLIVLLLLVTMIGYSQQKITIKSSDGVALGQFRVETYLVENNQEVELKGVIPTAESADKFNTFKIVIDNLVWFDPNTKSSLIVNSGLINVSNASLLKIQNTNQILTLEAGGGSEIHFMVNTYDYGEFRLNIAFLVDGTIEGRFLQSLSIIPINEMSSRDLSKIWKNVDKTSSEDVEDFIALYQSQDNAKRLINDAERALYKIQEIENFEASTNNVILDSSNEELRSIENVSKDIEVVIDHMKKPEEKVDESFIKNSSIILHFNDDDVIAKKVSVSELPLLLQFLESEMESDSMANIIPDISFEFQKNIDINEDLLKEHGLIGDFTKVRLVNAHNKVLIEKDLDHLTYGSNKYNIGLIALLLGGLAAIGLYVLYRQNQNKKLIENKQKNLASKIKQHKMQSGDSSLVDIKTDPNLSATPASSAPKKIVLGKKKNAPKIQAPSQKGIDKIELSQSGKLKILNRRVQSNTLDKSQFLELINSGKFKRVDLNDIWEDTSISTVYFKENFVEELTHFLSISSTNGITNELEGAIPEVGGFLMGRSYNDNDEIKLVMEKFVPFVPEYNDVFKIEIGTKTVVDELGDAQDKFPELDVVGWFHTHPGHGLFLSVSDLSVQRHFPKQYQVAMEIDSLTNGLDMTMFSRQKSGIINNTPNKKARAEWFSWVEIENEYSIEND